MHLEELELLNTYKQGHIDFQEIWDSHKVNVSKSMHQF